MYLEDLFEAGKYDAKRLHRAKDMSTAWDAAEGVIKILKKNAKQWMKASKNGKLVVFRGTESGKGDVFLKNVRLAREPRDSDKEQHILFNKIIEIAGGSANRSNSIFVTGAPHIAREYGQIHVCIPLGAFRYTWSSTWDDWTNASSDLHRMKEILLPDAFNEYRAYSDPWTNALAEFNKTVKGLEKDKNAAVKNKDRELAKALSFEIKELAKPKVALKWRQARQKFYEKKALELVQRPANQYLNKKAVREQFHVDTGLEAAIESEHEIMIQCASALYINPYLYENYVQKILVGAKPPDWDPHMRDLSADGYEV